MWLCLKWVLPPNVKDEEYVTMMMNYVYLGAFPSIFRLSSACRALWPCPTAGIPWASSETWCHSSGTMKKNGACLRILVGTPDLNLKWSLKHAKHPESFMMFPTSTGQYEIYYNVRKESGKISIFRKGPRYAVCWWCFYIFSGWLFAGRLHAFELRTWGCLIAAEKDHQKLNGWFSDRKFEILGITR